MGTYEGQLITGLVVLVMYLCTVFVAASYYIRLPNMNWLRAHEDAVRFRLDVTSRPDRAHAGDMVKDVLPAKLAGAEQWRAFRRPALNPLSWIGSTEIAGWVRLHEIQRLEVWQLPHPAVQARFARAMGQIDELPPVRQAAWQRRWVDLTQATTTMPVSDDVRQRWQAELSQLLAELFNARDATYNQLTSLYGKSALLLVTSYLLVTGLVIAGYGPIVLAGFVGGLISRMHRIIFARGRPTAYGTSWVPLFLAPLLGGLAAWAGLHLIALLHQLGIVDMAGIVDGQNFRLTPSTSVLGLAVLLGFSERLLNQLGNQAEQVVAAGGDGASAAARSPSAAAAGSPVRPFVDDRIHNGQPDEATDRAAAPKTRRGGLAQRPHQSSTSMGRSA